MITIKEVVTKRDLRKFVAFPLELYKDDPYFVPPLISDELDDWDRKSNPAFGFCEAKAFLAYKDGVAVGRIAAIYNTKANEKFGRNQMRFSQVDFIDDPEVSGALFDAVDAYARERGCDSIHGPLGFTDMDREGMLVEGFDQLNLFITYYNHPYYAEHLTRLGYVKSVDWIEYRITIPKAPVESWNKLADRIARANGLHILDIKSLREAKPIVARVFTLINECYAHLYGTTELNQEQITRFANKFLPLINFDYTCFVENAAGELVAFGVAAPSIDMAFKKSNGRLFPFGAFRVLHAMRHSKQLDLLLIGVKPELQGSAINLLLLNKVLHNCIANGVEFAETGPQLETNTQVLSQWKKFDKVQHKRRRCFIKELA
ncbi:MAG: hypothetical protein Q4B99_05485, partial [Clostridia bacterium]|nr:hypothetical protein [Clostridia bacterium]